MNNRKFDDNLLINATAIGIQTLAGYCSKKFPIVDGGNCFSLKTEKGYIKIVNFGVENLQHLLKEKIVEWPVTVLLISDKLGVILDKRVPKEYYWTEFCSICCPFEYLPTTQKIESWDRQLKGIETVIDCGEYQMVRIDYSKFKIGKN